MDLLPQWQKIHWPSSIRRLSQSQQASQTATRQASTRSSWTTSRQAQRFASRSSCLSATIQPSRLWLNNSANTWAKICKHGASCTTLATASQCSFSLSWKIHEPTMRLWRSKSLNCEKGFDWLLLFIINHWLCIILYAIFSWLINCL